MARCLLTLVPILTLAGLVAAQDPAGSIVIRPRPAKETVLAKVEFPPKAGSASPLLADYLATLNRTLGQDLQYSAFFRMPGSSFHPQPRVGEPEELDFAKWADPTLGIDFVVIGNARLEHQDLVVQCRVYDVKTREMVMGKQMRTLPRYTRQIAHRLADQIVALLTANASRGIAETQIVFERRDGETKEIYLMDYDGADPRPLTRNGSINVTPAWSPRGDRICFTSYHRGSPQLYTLSLDGVLESFPITGGLVTTPAYSPDGTQLAFAARLGSGSGTDIVISTVDGRNPRNVTQHHGISVSPTWSPTGRQIAFVSDRTGTPQLFLSDTYGAGLVRLTQEGGYAASPDWSPDGQYIAFTWRPPGMRRFDLYVVEVATRQVLQLTREVGNNENPSFSPDGRHIVFQSDRNGRLDIYTMVADGTEVRQLTRMGGCANPAWSGYPVIEGGTPAER